MRNNQAKQDKEVQDHIVKSCTNIILKRVNHCIDAKHMLVFAFAMISLYYHKPYTVLEPQVNICLQHTLQDKYNVACTFNSISSRWKDDSKLEKPDK